MENLTGGTPPVRYLPCVVPCKLYFLKIQRKFIFPTFPSTYNNLKWVFGNLIFKFC